MQIVLVATCAIFAVTGIAQAQQSASSISDQDYVKRVMGAAPSQVVEKATIVRMQNGAMQTVQHGTNVWTCMDPGGAPMCMDPNAMEWGQAWMTHGPAPEKTGFVYMLAGDTGASNTDPYATEKKSDNHWVETGSHVMIVGAAAKTLGYPKTADADPTKPYVMWAGSPYEHVMIPVK